MVGIHYELFDIYTHTHTHTLHNIEEVNHMNKKSNVNLICGSVKQIFFLLIILIFFFFLKCSNIIEKKKD